MGRVRRSAGAWPEGSLLPAASGAAPRNKRPASGGETETAEPSAATRAGERSLFGALSCRRGFKAEGAALFRPTPALSARGDPAQSPLRAATQSVVPAHAVRVLSAGILRER